MTKPAKGTFGGPCNRTACQAPGATYWNSSTRAYYCRKCAALINHQPGNTRGDGSPLCQPGKGDER